MLDAAFIREHLDAVKTNCRNRNVKADVDRVVQLDDERKRLIQQTQVIQQRQNEVSKLIPKEKDAARKQELIAEGKRLREEVAGRRKAAQGDSRTAARGPVDHPQHDASRTPRSAPRRRTTRSSRQWGEPRKFDFAAERSRRPRRGAATSSISRPARRSRGRSSTSSKTRRCCWSWRWCSTPCRRCSSEGYTPIITPDLARVEVLEGIGFIPRSRSGETQIYSLERYRSVPDRHGRDHARRHAPRPDLRRAGSAEEVRRPVALFPHRGRRSGPRHARPVSRASVHQGRDVRLLHAGPERAASTRNCWPSRKRSSRGSALPYHVIDTCTGDLGGPAYRKYDLEAWMPGRGQGGEYGEVTSTSNCTDYQARRLNIRYKTHKQKGTRFVHTLNGTAVAVHAGPARHSGEQPAGRRLGGGPGGAAAVGGQGAHRTSESLKNKAFRRTAQRNRPGRYPAQTGLARRSRPVGPSPAGRPRPQSGSRSADPLWMPWATASARTKPPSTVDAI